MPTTITYEMELKKAEIHIDQPFNFGGAPDTNRTCDPPLRRGMLYPLSYEGIGRFVIICIIKPAA